MAAAQYRNEQAKIDITRRLGAPQKATLEAWFKEIRKVIPEIPDPRKTDWQITHQEVKDKWINYELHNSIGQRCYITVNREIPHIGAS